MQIRIDLHLMATQYFRFLSSGEANELRPPSRMNKNTSRVKSVTPSWGGWGGLLFAIPGYTRFCPLNVRKIAGGQLRDLRPS